MYPDALIVLVLGGYFLERGDISIISKWNKTKIALDYGVDIVIELPTLYNTNSADIFAYNAVRILNDLKVDKLIFGSECASIDKLKEIAESQKDTDFSSTVQENLKKGQNYPTSLSTALGITLESNDILGVSYIKAIDQINSKIEPIIIKRTNDYNDIELDTDIVSASNIRERLKNNEDIKKYIPDYDLSMINKIDYSKLFELLRYRIITESHLERYLGVDEGLENRLKKVITDSHSYEELIELTKSKRYTTSRIKRMFIHILLGIKKDDINYDRTIHRVLGLSKIGQSYIKDLDCISSKANDSIAEIEKRAALIYNDLTNDQSINNEFLNKPIINDKK